MKQDEFTRISDELSNGQIVERCRGVLTELLMSAQPGTSPKQETTGDDELFALAERYAVEPRLPRGNSRPRDDTSKVIAVDHQACILCDRCIRACNDLQNNEVIGRTGKGSNTRIAFDLDAPMGESTCASCGVCASVCPTGALVAKAIIVHLRPPAVIDSVDSACT